MRYQGAKYVFGGVPSKGIGNWDCSSFVNWVVGNDCRMAIPGYPAGTYTGQTHGPVVLDWSTWSGASTHSGPPNPGDLCVWPGIGASGHIGIVIAGNQMISALDTRDGTKVTPIQGFGPAGVAVVYRQLSGVTSAGVSVPGCLMALVAVLMPYEIVPVGNGKYSVRNKLTGRKYSRATSKEKAEAQMRLLHAQENNPGWRNRRARRAAR